MFKNIYDLPDQQRAALILNHSDPAQQFVPKIVDSLRTTVLASIARKAAGGADGKPLL